MSTEKDKAIRKLDALKRAIEEERGNQTGIHVTNTDKLFVECHAAIAALQELEWISVKDRLPRAIVSVLACGWYDPEIDGCNETAWIGLGGKWWWDPKDEPCRCLTDEGQEPTHWMPLPKPPTP